MRLLNTTTYELKTFDDLSRPPYAILSHVWDREEVTFADMQDLRKAKRHRGWRKIEMFCFIARGEGYQWCWADTCCIDKSNDPELSKTLILMYAWYAEAGVCYAYLRDAKDMGEEDPEEERSFFRRSKWFKRGWTLPELIAPPVVVFFANNWGSIGTKRGLAEVVEEITRVDRAVLTRERHLDDVSIARRMSWAAGRTTTRVEDRVYSLMGVFNVKMVPAYGEGDKAFIRLQHEIIKASCDQSIFAWGTIHTARVYDEKSKSLTSVPRWTTDFPSMLASSPDLFRDSANIESLSIEELSQRTELPISIFDYYPTSNSINIHLPLITDTVSQMRFALLACQTGGGKHIVALLVHRMDSSASRVHVGMQPPPAPHHPSFRTFLLDLPLNKEDTTRAPEMTKLLVHSYNAHPQRSIAQGPKYGDRRAHRSLPPSEPRRLYIFNLPGLLLTKLKAIGFTVLGWESFGPETRAGWAPMQFWRRFGSQRLTLIIELPRNKGDQGPAQARHSAIVFRGPNKAAFVILFGVDDSGTVTSLVAVRGVGQLTEEFWEQGDYELARSAKASFAALVKDAAHRENYSLSGPQWKNGARTFGNRKHGKVGITFTPWYSEDEAVTTGVGATIIMNHAVQLEVDFGDAKLEGESLSGLSTRAVSDSE